RTAVELADRAEVTSRTVYRYLREDADFMSDLAERLVASMRPTATFVDRGDTSLDGRITAYISFRLGLHDQTARMVREVRTLQAHAPTVVAVTAEMRAIVRTQLTALFAPELSQGTDERARLDVAALQTLLLFDSLEYLIERARGDRRAVHDVLCRQFSAVLTTMSSVGSASTA
ncbi:MAG: hypothetical protein ABJ314_09255, partial [Ilumatobacter sp.]|uniref:hypothetical protein n=1 Tax=Ilumatobacter sp. TaxID=1967498 RepID=UPI003298DA49